MKIPAWSFSSLNDYTNCPRAYQLKRVTKACVQSETEAMRHGTIQHEHLELRVRDKKVLPPELQWIESSIRKLENSGGTLVAEQAVGLTKGLTPTGFFSDDVWVRGKLDLTVEFDTSSTVLDWKTGARKMNSDQLMLFAGFSFALRPEIEMVRTGYVWLKDKKIDANTFERKDVPVIWGHFLPKIGRLERSYKEDDWPARSSGLCHYCPATKLQCKYSKK